MRLLLAALFALCVSPWVVSVAHGFAVSTHYHLALSATNASQLDAFLQASFGSDFAQGVQTPVDAGCENHVGCNVITAIADGCTGEDDWARSLNHFHDPTVAWDDAGLRLSIVNHGQWLPPGSDWDDAAVWQQDLGQSFSWGHARDRYATALVAPSRDARVEGLAATFRDVGHLIHIVQDMAAPAHTRNDPHRFGDGFHHWAAKDRALTRIDALGVAGAQLLRPDPVLLQWPSPSRAAPAPIANLIDTTNETDPGIVGCGMDMGLAEYSNGRFVSDDRLVELSLGPGPGPVYREPSISEMDIRELVEPVSGYRTKYYYYNYAYACDPDYAVAPVPAWVEFVDNGDPGGSGPSGLVVPRLTNTIFEGYADLLLPRAVSYSAALIDYFVRGELDVQPACCLAPGTSHCWKDEPGEATWLRVNVSNASPSGEETSGQGKAWAVIESDSR